MNKKQILILKVSINESTFDYIKIHEDDEPDELANRFIGKHQLSPNKKVLLEKMIEKQIDVIVERDFKLIQETLNSNRSKTPIIRNQSRPNTHREISKIKSSGIVPSQKRNDLLLKKKKDEKILEIFQLLHPGRDQKISFGTIKNLDLSAPIFAIIRPVIEGIIEKKLIYGLKEFTKEVYKVVDGLNKSDLELFFSSNSKQSSNNYYRAKRYQQILN